MGETRQAFVSGGANLGDRAGYLQRAAQSLRQCPGIVGVACSSLYETLPVGFTDQPAFLNVVYALETTLSPESLLQELQRIENENGRVRHERWGPRTLDLDLLCYADETRATAELTLPHPRMFERGFVLVPLRELLSREAVRRHTPAELVRLVETTNVDTDGVTLSALTP